jgi:hypothetical protein
LTFHQIYISTRSLLDGSNPSRESVCPVENVTGE